MNGKLLTTDEKQANKRARICRQTLRKARRRREALLSELALCSGSSSVIGFETVTPKDGLEFLTAHLHRSRSIVDRIKRSVRVIDTAFPADSRTAERHAVQRPTRILREANCSHISPRFVDAQACFLRDAPVHDTITAAIERAGKVSPHALLDFLVGSSGLEWPIAADILFRRGLVPAAFNPVQIDAIRSAREFWDRYSACRLAYQASVNVGEISPASGDWGLIEHHELDGLLPGAQLPRAFKRLAYMMNLVRGRGILCLDLYAYPTCLPLIRHPL